MKYIVDQELPVVRNKAFSLTNRRGSEEGVQHASLCDALWFLLDMYQANPQLGMVLTNDETRHKRKCLAILEVGPQEQGYYRFEDADFAVMEKVVGWLGPYLTVSDYGVELEDRLKEAVTQPEYRLKEAVSED